MAEDDAVNAPCWLCGRPLGAKVELHHPVPRVRGGRATVKLHPICHQAIHSRFANGQLARIGADKAVLLADEGVAQFVAWVAGKSPDFHAPTKGKAR